MKSFLGVLAVVLSIGFATQAKADYYVWEDPATGVSLSFPDTWKRVSNADQDDVVTIMAPSGRAHAACRIRASADGRYLVYPPKYAASVQKVAYSYDFWNKYLAEYDDAEIYDLHDGAGLGRGFASYAIADYDSAVQGPYMHRRAILFATLYNDTAYILECSSHADAFKDWKKLFLSIAGSVDFEKANHEARTGNYRNFLDDRRIQFDSTEGPGRIVY